MFTCCWEREKERERERASERGRERERKTEILRDKNTNVHLVRRDKMHENKDSGL